MSKEEVTELEKRLQELQFKINKSKCFEEIVEAKSFLSQNKKEKFKKLGVYDDIELDVLKFCSKRISEINSDSVDNEITNNFFKEEEIKVLKKLVSRVISKDKSELPVNNNRALNSHNNVKKISQVLKSEETNGQSPANFVGRHTRTLSHGSLLFLDEVVNMPSILSRVRIDSVLEGNKAYISFLTGNKEGDKNIRARIDLNELAGFEYKNSV